MATPDQVLDFWLNEVGPEGWYNGTPALDDTIRTRFLGLWQRARAGELDDWRGAPRGMLGFLVLTDQFPRNMFRGSGDSFATDGLARATAKAAIARGWDLLVEEPERQFFYLPLMHAETLSDQERCVRLMMTRMPRTGASNLLHARAHREIIRRFGRFPYRNAALGRRDTDAERAFGAAGGYATILNDLTQAA